MQQTLIQKFNETAAAAYAAFPAALERLTVLLVPDTDRPVFVSPTVAAQLTKDIAAIKEAVREIAENMDELRAVGVAGDTYKLVDTPVNLIALDERYIGDGGKGIVKEMQSLFTLDHEIAHHIVDGGASPNEHFSECAADAFAMLRHIQRYGEDTPLLKLRNGESALKAILWADGIHYTIDTLERAQQMAAETGEKFFGLSLRETAALASKIARETALDAATIEKINNAYSAVADDYDAHDFDDVPRLAGKTLEVMNKHLYDPDIFEAGRRFFNCPTIKSELIADKAWQEKFARLNAHDPKAPPPCKTITRNPKP